ncbi:transglycosylase domain-containing protein [Cellulomonas cellasea]|uniref:transglycosylase domain-containing protein n=1 Tax=Cellulomonas cellasea TaxID=43670 RepID=UPI0025A48136|nr:transglycosylase domain-containing protein [Cellulomonas cellasea]MDM8086254.1 transglycosylase domain-containing protein [Cellulomonas cellasea]
MGARPAWDRQVNLAQAISLLIAFTLLAGVGGLLAAGLVLPAVAALKGSAGVTSTAFDSLPADLDVKAVSEKSTMLAADGTILAEFYAEDRKAVPLESIAPIMQQAVIATEDKRFYHHGGVDPTGMLRAVARNASGSDTQGASTLTQQYVKNVLIESALREGDRAAAADAREAEGTEGYGRKLREAKLAVALENANTKAEILEGYLNIAQFGIAVYGAESAAQRFFSKPASDLDYLESATLAGVTQSPTKWDPVKNPEASQSRRDVVLGLMLAQGYITADEHARGVATPLGDYLRPQASKLSCMAAGDQVPGSGFFCDYVTKIIKNDPTFGETVDDRLELLYRGGLTITTTLDPREQALADAEVKNGIPVDDPSGVSSAISVVEPGTGRVTAMAQNRVYNNTSEAPARQTATNFNTDTGYGGSSGFAPGSTFKPFTLLQWLREGHTLDEVVDASPMSYPIRAFAAPCRRVGTEIYSFGNAEGSASGPMTVLDATQNSVNSAYIAMATKLNLCSIMEGAASLGIVQGGNGKPFDPLPANVIGSQSVAPLRMAAAFAAFSAGGVYCKPVAITNVTLPDGSQLPVPDAACSQVVEPPIAAQLNFALGNVWSGTGKSLGARPYPASGKTGTTSHNEDTWFVGYNSLRSAAVWVGFSEGFIPVQNMMINGKQIKYTYGATIAGPTWVRYMDQAMEGRTVPGFGTSGRVVTPDNPVAVPELVGHGLDEATALLQSVGFEVVVGDPVPAHTGEGTVGAQDVTGVAEMGSTVTLHPSNGSSPPDRSASLPDAEDG